MAFRSENLLELKTNQEPISQPFGGNQLIGPKIFTYATTEDDASTVSGGSYFTVTGPLAQRASQLLPEISKGDLIYCSCSDKNVMLEFSAGRPSFTTERYTTSIKFASEYTTSGGAATENIAITGVEAADLAFVQLVDNGSNNVSVASVATTANQLAVTFSGNPGNDAIINYIIVRPI